MSTIHRGTYKTIKVRDDPDIEITYFNMDSMTFMWEMYDNIDRCNESSDLYLNEILNNNILICLGKEMLVTATKETHSNFQKWFPWFKWIYRVMLTCGIGPYKFVYDKDTNQFVPTEVSIYDGYLVYVYYKKQEYGEYLWCKNDNVMDQKKRLKFMMADLVYDSEIMFYMYEKPEVALAKIDNLMGYMYNRKVKTLKTPWKSVLRNILSEYRTYKIFEDDQLEIGKKKTSPNIHILPQVPFSDNSFSNWHKFYVGMRQSESLTNQQFFGITSLNIQEENVDRNILEKITDGTYLDDKDIMQQLSGKKKGSLITQTYNNYTSDNTVLDEPKNMQNGKYILHGPNVNLYVEQTPNESSMWQNIIDNFKEIVANILGLESNRRSSIRTTEEINKSNQRFNQKLRNIMKIFKDETRVSYMKANGYGLYHVIEELKEKFTKDINSFVQYKNKIPDDYKEFFDDGSELDYKYVLNEKGVNFILSLVDFNIVFQPNSLKELNDVILAYQNQLLTFDEARIIIQKNFDVGMGDLFYAQNESKLKRNNNNTPKDSIKSGPESKKKEEDEEKPKKKQNVEKRKKEEDEDDEKPKKKPKKDEEETKKKEDKKPKKDDSDDEENEKRRKKNN